MILSVKLKPEAGDKFKLRFEEVDVLLFIAHQFFKQVPGHVILGTMAIARRLLIKGAREHLSSKIAIQDLLDGLIVPCTVATRAFVPLDAVVSLGAASGRGAPESAAAGIALPVLSHPPE